MRWTNDNYQEEKKDPDEEPLSPAETPSRRKLPESSTDHPSASSANRKAIHETNNKMGAFGRWRDILLLASLSWNLFYFANIPLQYFPERTTEMQSETTTVSHSGHHIIKPMIKNSTATTKGFVRSPVIYGHVHYAKTTGTEINGILAAKYAHVCGHKAYSYDYYQFNERVRNSTDKYVRRIEGSDIISRERSKHNRGRIPPNIMDEIGYEDCDYISVEMKWQFWERFNDWPLELHVPCRDPLQHLLSSCNHNKHKFDCSNTNLRKETNKCFLGRDRFSLELETLPNTELKCFNPIPVERYIDYMGTLLEHRRFPTDYQHRDSNTQRIKEEECLSQDPKAAARVRQYLLETSPYYKWCDQCMGSANDLFA